MTITEFLEARIAEDERLARDAIEDDGGQDGGFEDSFDRLTKLVPGGFLPRFGEAAARMIVWNTPRRVLAECAAKRAVVKSYQSCQHAENEARKDISRDVQKFGVKLVASGMVKGMELAVKHLAAVYASHENYLPEWAM